MKLLLDMNIPIKYANLLAQKGFDVLLWSTVGESNATDMEIFAYAQAHDYIVLTFDLDFSAILSATHESKPSVVQIRISIPYAEQVVDIITTAVTRHLNELKLGAILSVDTNRARIRLLPL